MEVTVVVPARNESACIADTLDDIHRVLNAGRIVHSILVVNDHSTDDTYDVARAQALVINNVLSPGYGNAVWYGLWHDRMTSRADQRPAQDRWVTVMTADGSDSPEDLLSMLRIAWLEARAGWDVKAVFGTRFDGRAIVTGYPPFKRVANRLGNRLAARLVGTHYTDLTNPFKLYRADVVAELLPLLTAHDFSLGLELAVRFIQRYPHDFIVTGTDWQDRTAGRSKFKLKHAFGFLWRLRALGLL